ncbi:MAG: hypothetical protein FJ146_04560 [Deltaproteobacteria bacterium]|nr:hypothetical protein [Deltaproteobacteria bacterium]
MTQWINGRTQLMGLLGEQISYTMSPEIHNLAAARLGLNIVYLPLPMPAPQVRNFLHVAWDMGAVGFNVTTPHKALVASLVPGNLLSSVNTLYRGVEWWNAASTDGPGFVRGLRRMNAQVEEFQDLVFLGDGGAVTAILGYLAARYGDGKLTKLPRVSILARSKEPREHLQLLWPDKSLLQFSDLSAAALVGVLARAPEALLIQATSAPHRGDDLGYLVPALRGFRGAYCDLVYGSRSKLLQFCTLAGLRAQDGQAMLIEQALASQKLWWGQAAIFEDMQTALKARRTF